MIHTLHLTDSEGVNEEITSIIIDMELKHEFNDRGTAIKLDLNLEQISKLSRLIGENTPYSLLLDNLRLLLIKDMESAARIDWERDDEQMMRPCYITESEYYSKDFVLKILDYIDDIIVAYNFEDIDSATDTESMKIITNGFQLEIFNVDRNKFYLVLFPAYVDVLDSLNMFNHYKYSNDLKTALNSFKQHVGILVK